MTNIAVIGVGSMGQNHARVIFNCENASLKAIADQNKEQAERIARKYNTKAYTSYKELLEKEQIDAITVAVPTKYHKECALHVISQNKHVLIEKPIATTETEAQELIEAAQKNNVHLMVGHIERFNAAIIELKHRLENGELGEIYKVEVDRIGPFPERITDVGVITDLSVHDTDIIHYLTGAQPTRIYAETQRRLHPTHEDSVTALLTYDNGMLAVLNINYLSPTKIRQLSIFGKRGMFKVNYLTQELFFYENKSFGATDWSSVSEGDIKIINVPKKEPLQAEIEHFIQVIKDNTTVAVTGEDALHALRIAQYISRSAQEKRVITL